MKKKWFYRYRYTPGNLSLPSKEHPQQDSSNWYCSSMVLSCESVTYGLPSVVEWHLQRDSCQLQTRGYRSNIAIMAGNSLSSRYFRSMEEADEIVLASGASRIRHMSYGTVIYTPPFSGRGEEVARIDFGSEIATKKQLFCPRILLISTWTDGKFGFTGRTFLLMSYSRLLLTYFIFFYGHQRRWKRGNWEPSRDHESRIPWGNRYINELHDQRRLLLLVYGSPQSQWYPTDEYLL